MKKALVYSCIFHIILLSLFSLIEEYFKPEKALTEPVSVIVVPLTAEIPKSTLPKLPPIKDSREPKYLSAIPKAYEGEKIEEQKETESSEAIKSDKQLKEINTGFRSDIFDKDIIAKLARKPNPTHELEASHGLSFSTKEFNDWGYLERLKEKIERVWQYPLKAVEKGIYGDLYIRFTIDKKGRLASVQLLRTSGYRILDDAAIKALHDAQPFWPLPDDLGKESLTITGHFIYTLHGFYLR